MAAGGLALAYISPRTMCAANLNAIGKATALYMAEYGDWPLGPGILLGGSVGPSAFVCPDNDAPHPEDLESAAPVEYVDYALIPGLEPAEQQAFVYGFELPANHGQEGGNIVTTSFSCDWLDDPRELVRRLQQANDQLNSQRQEATR